MSKKIEAVAPSKFVKVERVPCVLRAEDIVLTGYRVAKWVREPATVDPDGYSVIRYVIELHELRPGEKPEDVPPS